MQVCAEPEPNAPSKGGFVTFAARFAAALAAQRSRREKPTAASTARRAKYPAAQTRTQRPPV
jgi:hypothetical protein